MPANLLTCADCSTQYALDLKACPHCGSSDFVTDQGAVTKRLPSFVSLSCSNCGRGPWTVRLQSVTSGLIEIPTLACTSCGCRVPVTWPPLEETMSPKITVHGGATNSREADVSPAADASEPLVGAEADQGRPTSEAAPELDEVQDETEAEEEKVADYDGMTLGELRDAASSRKLPSYGTKNQIIERLRDADAGSAE